MDNFESIVNLFKSVFSFLLQEVITVKQTNALIKPEHEKRQGWCHNIALNCTRNINEAIATNK